MKNTIRNTVSEVYKQMNNNYSFNRDLLNFNNNVNVKNEYKNTNSNKRRNMNTNADVLKKNVNTSSNSIYIFLILFLIFLFLIGIVFFFKENILNFLKKLFKDEEDDVKIKELEDIISKQKKIQDETNNTIMKIKKENTKKEDTTKSKKKMKRNTAELLKEYTPEQIVKNDGYCYIGIDDNMRHCEKVYTDDICQSGDIYNRIDECLVPTKY